MSTNSSNGEAKLSRAARRLAMLIAIPLAVVGGVHAVSWAAAQLKTWADGDTLTAADLNANFAALAAEQTPAKVVDNFNMGVTGGATVTLGAINPASAQYDLSWMIQHAAAAGACAAVSPAGDSGSQHVVVAKPAGVTCAAACAANTGGSYTTCRTSIAIGSVRRTQASAYTDVLANNYNYGCNDSQNLYDETKGQGLTAASYYTAYCCCFKAP
jgi:hypothetical protein